jgi:hypothetical protein
MDVFLILQIIFDAVLLFGILFLFHFSVNEQQKKKEELDIVKDIQVQEMKENLEKLLSAMKQLGKDVSSDIQNKIEESEEKMKVFNQNIKNFENQFMMTSNLSEKAGTEKDKLKSKVKVIRTSPNRKNEVSLDDKGIHETASSIRKEAKSLIPQTGYSIGFSSGIIKQVYKMIDGNRDIGEVVKATKLTKAEVNLILNLRENRFTAPN